MTETAKYVRGELKCLSHVIGNASMSHQGSPGQLGLVIPVSPCPEESLLSVLARAAHENLISNSRDILCHAGISKGTLGSVATRHAAHQDELATLIGVAPSELERLFYPGFDRKGAYGREIDMSGIRLSLRCREGKRRRISPAALRISPYHRMQWEMRFIHWCTETSQYLTDSCGACGGRLGWEKYQGIHVCERCGADLRNQEVDYVDYEYRVVAKDLGDLVGSADRSAIFRTRLHEDLRGLNEFDILKLVLTLASEFMWHPKQVHLALCDSNRATAPSLETWARGLERLFLWPEYIYGYLEKQVSNKTSGSGYGMLLQVGRLALHVRPMDADLPRVLRKTIDCFYEQNGIVALRPIGKKEEWHRPGWITVSEAKAKFELTDWMMHQALKTPDVHRMSHSGGKRAPTLVLEDDIRLWAEKFKKAVTVGAAVSLIGIPEFAIWELVESGVISVLTSEQRIRTPRVGCFDTNSVMALREALLDKASLDSNGPADLVPLARAILDCPVVIPPWSKALEMILSGDLPFWRQSGEQSSFVSDLMIEKGALFSLTKNLEPQRPHFREAPQLIGFDNARDLLRVSREELNMLVKIKEVAISKMPLGQQIVRSSLYEYALSRISTGTALVPDNKKSSLVAGCGTSVGKAPAENRSNN